MTKLKFLILSFFLLLSLVFTGCHPVKTSAFDLFGDVCSGQGSSSTACQEKLNRGGENRLSGPNGIIKTAANIMALVTGIAAVIVIIIGGLSFVTAGGNAEQAATARRRVLFALVGLVVVALAWSIVTFATNHLVNT
jgi:type IV secretion system pilin